jgi:hypothetical protein
MPDEELFMVFSDLISNLKLYYEDLAKNRIAPFYDSVKDYDGKDLTNNIDTKKHPSPNTIAAKEYFLGIQRSHLMRTASPKDYYAFAENDLKGRAEYLTSIEVALAKASQK